MHHSKGFTSSQMCEALTYIDDRNQLAVLGFEMSERSRLILFGLSAEPFECRFNLLGASGLCYVKKSTRKKVHQAAER